MGVSWAKRAALSFAVAGPDSILAARWGDFFFSGVKTPGIGDEKGFPAEGPVLFCQA